MNKANTLLLVAVATLALAGCGRKKAPDQLPPVPEGSGTLDPGAGDGSYAPNAGGADSGPGSQSDFVRSISSDRVFFDLDQYNLDATDQATLASQAEWLRRYPNVRVVIEGHADERGTRDYNLALGERRANAAKNYLASLGIDAARIQTISYGKERPEALGSDEQAWAQNRRAVTVTVR
jgi:peptidoglycan-associated lipoprotein